MHKYNNITTFRTFRTFGTLLNPHPYYFKPLLGDPGVGSGSVQGELLGGGLGLVGHGALPQVVPSLRLQGSLTDPLAVRLSVRVALRLRFLIFTIWGSFRLDGCAIQILRERGSEFQGGSVLLC